ncbi:hypothetical protein MF406_14360 [Georgenia sp. TF02-10]|uniref:hypothetical protein n=1 Tax=Georgenia sp. TF02-10 TaxID=2917725 RepID=UPI001FA70F21|nr:hypothetical protein [Georgenia sp. TF02-10]UNX54115.1 hypothetical protein MF406_14360 [Georgenia sp. TF02-10]
MSTTVRLDTTAGDISADRWATETELYFGGDLELRLRDDQAVAVALAILRAGMSLDDLVEVHQAVMAQVETYSDDGFAQLDDRWLCTRCLAKSARGIDVDVFESLHRCPMAVTP